MSPAKESIQKLAELMARTAPLVEQASDAFEKLKAAIEAEGYQVIWHMHSGDYSIVKREPTNVEK